MIDIHPLALEDVLHQRGNQARSKADYYYQHVYIRILRHALSDEDDSTGESIAPSITRLPRSASPDVIRRLSCNDDNNGEYNNHTLPGLKIIPRKSDWKDPARCDERRSSEDLSDAGEITPYDQLRRCEW